MRLSARWFRDAIAELAESRRARAVDTPLLPEQARHVLAGPDLARNAVQLGTALQHLKQTGALLRAQRVAAL